MYAYVIGIVSRFLLKALECYKMNFDVSSRSSWYIACFGGNEPTLVGYADSDMAGNINFKKSSLGFMIKFARGVMAWQSKL